MHMTADLKYLKGLTGLHPVNPQIWQTILVGLTNFRFGQAAGNEFFQEGRWLE